MNDRIRRSLAIAPLGILLVLLLVFSDDHLERRPGGQPLASDSNDSGSGAPSNAAAGKRVSALPLRQQPADAPGRLLAALSQGIPLRVTLAGDEGKRLPTEAFDLYVRPMRALAEEFQITVGSDFSKVDESAVHVFEGWSVSPAGERGGRTTVAMVDGALAAVVRYPSGSVTELKTDPETGEFLMLKLDLGSAQSTCSIGDRGPAPLAKMTSQETPFSDEDWEPAEIMPQWGSDPATGEITKYEQPIPDGQLYDLSLPDATVMIVLAKDATGSDSAANLSSRASTYLARMANVATIWENQLGIRLLVSELILTPDTAAFEDVGESLSQFRSWGEANRPRSQFPRSVAARFGNLGFSGNVVGTAFVGGVASGSGYSINKTNYNFTLVSHEMGHNFGSNHSSGGIMNATLQSGQRDFFRNVSSGETAAKDIYDHSASRLFNSATLRHAEEIPFAHDDSLSTAIDTPLLFEPLGNDDASVRNGATNSLSIAEVSRVYPIAAGTAEIVADSAIVFTPADGFEGFAWFSYSLQGDVGNGGDGWLHRGDVAVLVGADLTDSSNLTLAPGESIIFDPPGSGSASIQTPATQALVDVTRDDNTLLIIRADAAATGGDSFVVRRSSTNHTVNITYSAQLPFSAPDVVHLDPGASSVRFSPMANDDGIGYRRPLQIGARIGVDGTSEDYFVNAFRLVSATNLNPEKGTLDLEMLAMVSGGTNVSVPSGIMNFTPIAGATGVADIEYVIEDVAGNQATEIVSVVLSLFAITSPTSAAVNLPIGVGLVLEGAASSSSAGALSGAVTVKWQTVSAPAGASAVIADPFAVTTSVKFSDPGAYVLRATGSDSGHATTEEITLVITSTAPAGENLGTMVTLTDNAINVSSGGPFDLSAALPVVSDDGLPNPPAATSTTWSQVSGSGPVVFGDAAAIATSATFPYPGSYNLRLTADDGEVKTFDEVTLSYTGPGNGVPVTSGIADVKVSENASAMVIDLFPVFEDGEDVDADLVYSIETNTNPGLFNSAAIAGDPEQLTLEFAAGTSGSSQLTVRAMDSGGLFVDASFTVTVSNAAPVIDAIADQAMMEGQTLNLAAVASDADGLSYGLISGSPSGMSIDPVSGALSWTPGEIDGPGTHPVAVKVVDSSPQALSAIEYFSVTVGEVNQPPDIAPIADITNFAQADFTLTPSVSDPDLPANTLSFGLDSSPSGASITSQDGTIAWTPTVAGNYAFTVRVDDGGSPNLSDTESFSIEVINAAPTMADQSFTIAENSPIDTEIGTVIASDGDGDDFTFAITGGNPGSAFAIDPDTGMITVDSSVPLDFEENSSLTFTLEATDDDAAQPLARAATITVNLSDLNEAPSLLDQTLEVAPGEVFGALAGTITASDPEDDALTYAIVSGNEAGTFSLDPQTGELSIVALATLTQPVVLTVSVEDTGAPALSDSGLVTIALTEKLVTDPTDVRVFVPVDDSLSASWKDVAFDDSAWIPGQTGVGYERDSGYESLINADVEIEMYDNNASVWIRIPFNVADPATVSGLSLQMKYDDGYVAYLNGHEIARRNAPAGAPAWDAAASADHDDAQAIEFEKVDVSAFTNLLASGSNLLAIHGLNISATDSDMLIVPQLVATVSGTIGLTTLAEFAPSASTDSITETTASLNGDLTFNGGEDPEVFAVWGTSDGGTDLAQWDDSHSAGVLGEGAFSVPIIGLVAGTDYFFRFYAVNSGGTAWSSQTETLTTLPLQMTATLIASGATAKYRVPSDATDEIAWRARGYDDSSWTSGPTGIGYERESGYGQLIGTDVEAEMYNENASVYIRLPFDLVDPASLSSLTLRMKYDDAYVAFINGTEIARSPNAPVVLTWDAAATTPRLDPDAVIFEDVDVLAAAAGSLVEGENVLAIHGLNDASDDMDALFLPELISTFAAASYPGWITQFPQLQGDDRLLSADPDGDEMNNFYEFASGLNPAFAETEWLGGELIRPEIVQGDPMDPIALPGTTSVRFRRRIDYVEQGLEYEVQMSSDLMSDSWFRAFAEMSEQPTPTGDGLTEIVTLHVFGGGPVGPEPPGGSAQRQFFRIQISKFE